MMKLKSRLARLLRNWAQRLNPEFKIPPIQYTINRVHRIEVSIEDRKPYVPVSIVADLLKQRLIVELEMYGAIKITCNHDNPGETRYTASMYAMICGDKEGDVS